MEKWFSFLPGDHQNLQVFFGFSCSLSFSSCETHFPTFWIFPMTFKHMVTPSRVTFNWSASCCCVWPSSSTNNAYNSASSNSFSGLPRSSFLTSNSPLLNFLNHSKPCDLPRACHRNLRQAFCSSFLQMITENLCCPRIVVFRHKFPHVHRYEKYVFVLNLYFFELKLFGKCKNKKIPLMMQFQSHYIDN